MASDGTDRTTVEVASMNRAALSKAILALDCDFPVDLTHSQLSKLSLEKLRHVYLALRLHGRAAGKSAS